MDCRQELPNESADVCIWHGDGMWLWWHTAATLVTDVKATPPFGLSLCPASMKTMGL